MDKEKHNQVSRKFLAQPDSTSISENCSELFLKEAGISNPTHYQILMFKQLLNDAAIFLAHEFSKMEKAAQN
jgi:hypothetical protein